MFHIVYPAKTEVMYSIHICVVASLFCLTKAAGEIRDEIQMCGSPPTVLNATRSPDEKGPFKLGTVIIYACDRGYLTDGRSNTAECRFDEITGSAEWISPSISCRPRSCGDPGYVNNAQRVGALFIFPHSVEYICKEGYKLIGRNKRYCQPTGTWTGHLPRCQILSCPSPKKIQNGETIYGSTEYGSTVEYKCDHGYRLEGTQSMECRANATWSEEPPVCIEVECPLPRAPVNGSMTTTSEKLTVNSIVMFSCKEGLHMIGSRTAKCRQNGEWTFETPVCTLPCHLPTLHHGHFGLYERKFVWRSMKYVPKFKRIDGNVKLLEGESVVLRCDKDYEALGEDQHEANIACSQSKLLPVPICFPAKCRITPPSPLNGFLVEYSYEHNNEPVYECDVNYKKVKEGKVKCKFGSWKGEPPTCNTTLCPASALANLRFSIDVNRIYTAGESIQVICHQGYEEVDGLNQIITCVDGVWRMSNTRPCRPAQCVDDPPRTPNLIAHYQSKSHGVVVRYECEQGYRAKTSYTEVKCEFGLWKGEPPTCKDTRCHIPQFPFNEGLLDFGPVQHSSRVNVRCKDGFIVDISSMLCFDGRFIRVKNPPCIPDPSLPPSSTLEGKDRRPSFISSQPSTMTSHQTMSSTNVFSSTEPTVHTSTSSAEIDYNMKNNTDQLNGGKVNLDDKIQEVTTVQSLIDDFTRRPQKNPCLINIQDKFLQIYLGDLQMEFGSRVPHGFSVKFHCQNIGYHRLTGAKEALCDNGIWRPHSFPMCKNPKQGDVVIHYYVQPENRSKVTPDGVVRISPGTTLYLICYLINDVQYGRWDVTLSKNMLLDYVSDVERNMSLSTLNISDVTKENAKSYTCYSPHFSTFTISVEVKELECPKIPLTRNLIVRYIPDREYLSVASFRCQPVPMWHLEGPINITCLAKGKWSSPPAECRHVKCPMINASDGLSVQYILNKHSGDIAHFDCPPSWNFSGPVNITCLPSGQWSASPPTCKKMECSVVDLMDRLPPHVVFEWLDESFIVPYGYQLVLKCDSDGHVIKGDNKASCSSDREWTFGRPECVKGCRSLLKPENSSLLITVEKDYYRFGEQVTFSCPEGQKTNIQRAICLANGWSVNDVPDCKSL